MPNNENQTASGDSGLARKIKIVTGIVLALAGLTTAAIKFRDSIPWLTPVNTIDLPSTLDLAIGDKIRVVATPRDVNKNPLNKIVNWSSANPSIVEVDRDGIVTGKAAGQTTITASVGYVKAGASVHVRHVNVAKVNVFPPAATLLVNEHLKFDATPYDREGNSLMGRKVIWASENPLIASVDRSSGETTGKSTGSVRITAMSEEGLSSAQVTVNQPTPIAADGDRSAGASNGAAAGSGMGARVGRFAVPRPPAAGVVRVPPKTAIQPRLMTLAFAEKIAITNGLKFGNCRAKIRILFNGTLIDIKSDPQEVAHVPTGDQHYDLHGTVSCPRQTVGVVNGHGTISIANGKTYHCVWSRKGTKDFTITLQPQ